MDKILIIVCAVVGSLGVLSAIFGFSAEGTKLTPDDIAVDVVDDECIYPPKPAFGLGVSAAIFLLAAQVTFTAVGGCCGCCNKSRSNPSQTKRVVGIICAVVSWIAAVIAWVLLIEGAVWNEHVVRTTGPELDCYYLKDGVFAGAGVLSLAATALGVTSYVLTRMKAAAAPPVVPAEGEPKLPPAATQGDNASSQNQEVKRPPADTVTVPLPATASAPPEPAGEPTPTPPAGAEMDQQLPVQLPQAVGVPIATMPQMTNANNPLQQQQGYEHLIRNELTKAGIRLAGRVLEHSLFSDSIVGSPSSTTMPGVGDILDSMTNLQPTDALDAV